MPLGQFQGASDACFVLLNNIFQLMRLFVGEIVYHTPHFSILEVSPIKMLTLAAESILFTYKIVPLFLPCVCCFKYSFKHIRMSVFLSFNYYSVIWMVSFCYPFKT